MKKQNPFRDLLVFLGMADAPTLSPLAIAVADLEQAQRDSLRAEAEAEEATNRAGMLVIRIDRLHATVRELNNAQAS